MKHSGLEKILREASSIKSVALRIEFLSGLFIGTEYREGTLVGSADKPEVLIMNVEAVDCFTFIDYVEALRLSGSYQEFSTNLERVRYRSGLVNFETRNHFFTDWTEFNAELVSDVTPDLGGNNTLTATKVLNEKEDGTPFVSGIPPKHRILHYIPPEAFNRGLATRLITGDYAGIYSHMPGLDVSHVGIIVKKREGIFLRHASSVRRQVVDEDFLDYIADKPGIILLRPKGSY